jgi:hypothetical protein
MADITASQPYIQSPNLTAVNRTLSQRVEASREYQVTVYESHYAWLIGNRRGDLPHGASYFQSLVSYMII